MTLRDLRPSIRLKFEPRDLWIGIYWDRPPRTYCWTVRLDVYACLVPCFPVHLRFHRER